MRFCRARPRALVRGLLCLATLATLPCRPAAANDARFWLDALAATEERRHGDVVALLQPVSPRVRGARGDLLLALALASENEPAEALKALPTDTQMADWPERVRSDLARRRVQWAARAGLCEVLEGVELDTPNLQVAAARCALEQDAPEQALARLAGLDRRIDARELRAQAHAEAGDDEASLAVVRELWLDHPAHPHAARWQARLEEAGPLELSAEEHIRRAKGFVDARKFNTAVAELEGVRVKGRRRAAALWHLRGMALFRARTRYPEAAKALSRAASLEGATEASDVFHAARARSRAGRNERAIREYRRFVRRYPKSSLVVDALFFAAWLEAREGRPKAAWYALRRLTRQHARALARDRRTRESVLWEMGFLSRKLGWYGRAARELSEYGEVARDPMERARGHYWAADSLARIGRRQKAHGALSRAAHADPLGYYAVLAQRKARDLGLPAPEPFPESAEEGELARPEVALPPAARFYAELSLTGLSVDALGSLRGRELTERVALLLETGHAEASHRTAHALSEQLLARPVTEDSRWLWRALYPTPFSQAVTKQTAKWSLPPDLIHAHMLVESRFDPAAVSGAGARGLLQLMPATARRVAATLGEESDPQRLLNPAFNIELGARYLSRLIAHFEGDLPPAIASYNGGRGNVERWLEAAPGPLDQWVEEIPVQQTRNYVRRVLTHWTRYRYLRDADRWAPELPEEVGPRPPQDDEEPDEGEPDGGAKPQPGEDAAAADEDAAAAE